MPDTESHILCKNIFKDDTTATSKDKFTRAWINLINQLEKSKKYNSYSESRTVTHHQ